MSAGARPSWASAPHVFSIAMTTRFRGITTREGMLFQGPAGWVEWSPFLDYHGAEIATWWQATREAAELGWPAPVRDRVEVNATVPVIGAEQAHALVLRQRCRTAKLKVADVRSDPTADELRIEAVRDALGASGRIRLDANGLWDVDTAYTLIKRWSRHDLEYVEQPCASVEELAQLRRRLARAGVDVPIAADESIRRSGDPERVVALEAADIAVLKVQPLGGVRRCLQLAEQLGLPVVVSSALETSVGLRAGLALAAALPELPYACGLNTAALLTADVVDESLIAVDGSIAVSALTVAPARLTAVEADAERSGWWQQRLGETLALSAAGVAG